jgi:hypothetical protein
MVRALRRRAAVGLDDCRLYAQETADVLLIHMLSSVGGNLCPGPSFARWQ